MGWTSGIAAGAAASVAATVPPVDDAAARFGAREAVEQVGIAPDGRRVSMILARPGRGNTVAVVDLGGDAAVKPIASSTGDPERFYRCGWLTDTRLACGVVTYLDRGYGRFGYTRYVTYGSDGGEPRMLSVPTNDRSLDVAQDGGALIDWSGPADDGTQVLMTHRYVGESTIGRLTSDERRGLGVDAVDTTTLRRRVVEPPRTGASEYISDGHGAVRIMGIAGTRGEGYLNGDVRYFYRSRNAGDWQLLGTLSTSGVRKGFDPYAVDRDLDVAYGFDTVDGRRALVRVALDGSMKRDVLLARPDVDVDALVTIGRQHRVVGASYATDRRTVRYFDPAIDRLQTSLEKALPGKQVSITDASKDENRLVLFVDSDTDPGRYYLFTKADRKLAELLPVRPQLAGTALSPVRSITYPAADGTPIPAYLTLPPAGASKGLPAIVLPHGGPAARDEWGFDWLVQFFAHQGYAVLQPQFRGSAGYGDAWFQKNGFQSWRTAVGDVNDAGRYLLSSGIAAPGRLAVFGWSYGGYAALQSAALDPRLFKAVVAVAPVTDLETLRGEARDTTLFSVTDRFIGQGEHVRSGSPAQNASAFLAPVLLFHGTVDNNVGVGESRLMAARLRGAGKQVDYVEYPGLDHYLNDGEVRADMLRRSDAFIRKSLGM